MSGLSGTDILEKSISYCRYNESLTLRDIQEGIIPMRCGLEDLSIVLGKSEYVVWIYKNVKAYEEKTGRRYQGRSRGVSFKICKGVYYRVGATDGHSVSYQYQDPLGQGNMIITNKNVIYNGSKSIKVPINKIISYQAYTDGIKLTKDATEPKDYTFVGCDAWFIINAIQLLVD